VLQVKSVLVSALFFWSSLCAHGFAQEINSEVATQIVLADGAELFRIDELIAAQQFPEAVDLIVQLLQKQHALPVAEQQFAPTPIGTAKDASEYLTYLPVRIDLQQKLAGFAQSAPIALQLYRVRVDPAAKVAFEQAIAAQDATALTRMLSEFFPSAICDDALLTLGDYHLEAARFERARECWLKLLPAWREIETVGQDDASVEMFRLRLAELPADVDSASNVDYPLLNYPDTDIPQAEIAARLVFCSLLQQHSRAERELKLFQKLFPQAVGNLFGKSVNLSEALQKLHEEQTQWPARTRSTDYLTWGGDASRNAEAVGTVDPAGTPLWSVELRNNSPVLDAIGLGRPRVGESRSGLLSYFPVVSQNQVAWHDGETVRVLDLFSGKSAWPYDPQIESSAARRGEVWQPAISQFFAPIARPQIGSPRFVSLIDQRRLFVRVGNRLTAVQDDEPREATQILGFDLREQAKLLPGFPLESPAERIAFEGTPVVVGDRLYVALRESAARSSRVTLHLACYQIPALRTATHCRQLWQVPLCSADSPAAGKMDEITNVLLTEVQGTLYCNTNLGAIVACDLDGRMLWIAKYARRSFQYEDFNKQVDHYFREPNPCLFHDGLLFAAPADSPEIFAIEAATGRLRWRVTAASASQLLGTTETDLIVTGNGIHWIDLNNGHIRAGYPMIDLQVDTGFARAGEATHGRGIITNNAIYWPTREKIFVFGKQLRQGEASATKRKVFYPDMQHIIDLRMRGIEGGNLVISKNILLIATENRLVAFNETGQIAAPPTEK
jgi:outer membrane protein assembly factor BamB